MTLEASDPQAPVRCPVHQTGDSATTRPGNASNAPEDERTAHKRSGLAIAMGCLSRVLAAPERTDEVLHELHRDLGEAGVDDNLARLLARDVALGAILHRPTLHAFLSPAKGARVVRVGSDLPFYVDGYYFTHVLSEPLNSVFLALADGALTISMRQFPELFSAVRDVKDPLLRAAIDAQDRLPLQPWESEMGLGAKQRLVKLIAGSIVDDVFSAVALVVGAEQLLLDDLPNARSRILANLSSLRLPALIDREHLVQIWRLKTPFNTDDGRLSGIPVVEMDSGRFHYPNAASGKSMCVGMYPVVLPRLALDEVGGYDAFREHMGPNIKEQADGSILYRLVDVDLANVCAFAERYWADGKRLAPHGTFELPTRPKSAAESDHWPILF